MSRKMKLVLRTSRHAAVANSVYVGFEIVKAVNTLEYGVPGDKLTRKEVDTVLSSACVVSGELTVEVLKK